MSPRSRSALARFLDRISGSYPWGIPSSVLRCNAAPAVICSLLVVTDQPALPDDERALVEAICSKGLKVPFERCCVTLVRPRTEIPAAIGALREAHGSSPGVTIVFGANDELGTIGRGADGVVLTTHGLGRIAKDQAAKRETWAHLQGLLPLLSGAAT